MQLSNHSMKKQSDFKANFNCICVIKILVLNFNKDQKQRDLFLKGGREMW